MARIVSGADLIADGENSGRSFPMPASEIMSFLNGHAKRRVLLNPAGCFVGESSLILMIVEALQRRLIVPSIGNGDVVASVVVAVEQGSLALDVGGEQGMRSTDVDGLGKLGIELVADHGCP